MQGTMVKAWIGALALLAGGCVSAQRHSALEQRLAQEREDRSRMAQALLGVEQANQGLRQEVEQERARATAAAQAAKQEREQLASSHQALDAAQQKVAALEKAQKGLSRQLDQTMRDLARQAGIEYDAASGRLKLTGQVLFDAGQARLHDRGQETLRKLAFALKGGGEWVRIEGHTDAEPVRATRGRWSHGNWELSGYRALEVLAFLEKEGVDGRRMQFVGCGPYHPIDSNVSTEGKSRNRRVEIYVLPPRLASPQER